MPSDTIPSMDRRIPEKPVERDWFHETFDELYLVLYAHRDEQEAREFLGKLDAVAPLARERTLDLGCGSGRYLGVLREAGVPAVGLDLSLPLLLKARRTGPDTPLARGDMRRVPFRDRVFTTVLLMFTTFGYFATDQEQARVLCEVSRVLEDGGTLVLDTIHSGHLRSHLEASSERIVGGLHATEKRWVDPTGPFLRKRTVIDPRPGCDLRVYEERVRLYEPSEVDRMVVASGFRIRDRLGDYEAHRFDARTSPRYIVLAQKGTGGR